MRNKHKAISCFLLSCTSFMTQAANQTNLNQSTDLPHLSGYQGVSTLTLGPEFVHLGHSQTIRLLPPFSNRYTQNNAYKSIGSIGLMFGVEHQWTEKLFWQLGLSGYLNSPIKNKGNVWQFSLPQFNNSMYHYQIETKRLMASGKILSRIHQKFLPYISAELGGSFNRAKAYDEIPLIDGMIPAAPFHDHTHTSFSYGIGAGFDIDINKTFRIGVGYQFADLGKARLNPNTVQLTHQAPGFTHLYSHQCRFQFTALI